MTTRLADLLVPPFGPTHAPGYFPWHIVTSQNTSKQLKCQLIWPLEWELLDRSICQAKHPEEEKWPGGGR